MIGQQRLSRLPSRVRSIVVRIAEEEGVPAIDIMGDERSYRVAGARHRAMAEIRFMPFVGGQPSLPQIGAWFGRDHTSVLHALRKLGVDKKQYNGLYALVGLAAAEASEISQHSRTTA